MFWLDEVESTTFRTNITARIHKKAIMSSHRYNIMIALSLYIGHLPIFHMYFIYHPCLAHHFANALTPKHEYIAIQILSTDRVVARENDSESPRGNTIQYDQLVSREHSLSTYDSVLWCFFFLVVFQFTSKEKYGMVRDGTHSYCSVEWKHMFAQSHRACVYSKKTSCSRLDRQAVVMCWRDKKHLH